MEVREDHLPFSQIISEASACSLGWVIFLAASLQPKRCGLFQRGHCRGAPRPRGHLALTPSAACWPKFPPTAPHTHHSTMLQNRVRGERNGGERVAIGFQIQSYPHPYANLTFLIFQHYKPKDRISTGKYLLKAFSLIIY